MQCVQFSNLKYCASQVMTCHTYVRHRTRPNPRRPRHFIGPHAQQRTHPSHRSSRCTPNLNDWTRRACFLPPRRPVEYRGCVVQCLSLRTTNLRTQAYTVQRQHRQHVRQAAPHSACRIYGHPCTRSNGKKHVPSYSSICSAACARSLPAFPFLF